MFNCLLSSNAAIDVILICLMAVFAVYGFIKGFTSLIVSFLAGILTLVLSFVLCSNAASFLNRVFGMTDKISESLAGALPNLFGEELMNMPVFLVNENNLGSLSVPKFIVQLLLKIASDGSVPPETPVVEVLAPTFAYYIAVVIGFILCYILFRILFFLLGKLFKGVNAIPVLGSVNRLLGLLLGAIQGFIVVYIALSVVDILPFGFLEGFKNLLAASKVASGIMSINVFGILFGTVNPIDYITGTQTALLKGAFNAR